MTVDEYELANGAVEVTGTGLETAGTFRHGDRELDEPQDPVVREALEVGVLCNNASIAEREGETKTTGDPMEVALLIAGTKGGIDRDELLESTPEAREVSFDPSVKMMATYHGVNGAYKVAVKGAPEAVIDSSSRIITDGDTEALSESDREVWLRKSDRMAEDGLRVLALARKEVESTDDPPYEDLELLGLVGFIDPPREEVRPTIRRCQDAGMRVVMVTGDHAGTAKNIAHSVGLVDADDADVIEGRRLDDLEGLSGRNGTIRERVCVRAGQSREQTRSDRPSSGCRLYRCHDWGRRQRRTGAEEGRHRRRHGATRNPGRPRGVGHDPQRRQLREYLSRRQRGRTIFRNIRKFVLYLMSCNLSELLTILIAALLSFPLPLLPLQILFLNVVTDVFPAFALGACEGSRDIMDRPPRDPDEPIMTRINWTELGSYGLLISVATIGAFTVSGGMYAGGLEAEEAVTISFLTLAFAQLWHVFNMREITSGIFRNEVIENLYVWGALSLSALILFGAVYLPGISVVLRTTPIGYEGWLVVFGMSLLPLGVGQIEREFRRRVGTAKLGVILGRALPGSSRRSPVSRRRDTPCASAV